MSDKSPLLPLTSSLTSKMEYCILAAVFLTGLFLRVYHWDLIEIEHFDEAVYSTNLYFKNAGMEAFPGQAFFAPPFLPQLMETLMTFFGDSKVVIFSVNLIASLLNLVLLWWMGRTWFGPVCGLVAAAFFATSDYQIVLSRSVLTEPLMGLFFCLAIFLMSLAFRFTWNTSVKGETSATENNAALISPHKTLAVIAGLVCSLCWVTKYNGWLPCAILLTALVINLILFHRWFHVKHLVVPVLLMLAGTFLLRGLHVWQLIQDKMYAVVNEHHKNYFVWIDGWWTSFREQKFQLDQSTGILTVLLLLILVISIIYLSSQSKNGKFNIGTIIQMLIPISVIYLLLIGQQSLMFLLLTGYAVLMMYFVLMKQKECFTWNILLPVNIMLVWWGSLLVAIPLYSPYPRLLYPWLLVNWLGAGLVFALLIHFWNQEQSTQKSGVLSVGNLLFSLILISAGTFSGLYTPPGKLWKLADTAWCDGWQDKTGLLNISRETFDIVREHQSHSKQQLETVVYSISKPAFIFHLNQMGVLSLPIQDLGFVRNLPLLSQFKVYLLIGFKELNDEKFAREFARYHGKFILLKSFRYVPSKSVWSDYAGDETMKDEYIEEIRLYEYNP